MTPRFLLGVCLLLAAARAFAGGASSPGPGQGGPSFEKKLQGMLLKSDRSIKLLRQQISESQSAPFLPDLYMQLAELHSDKANNLYYLQKERQKDLDTLPSQDKAFGPVIEETQEAIKTYRLVLKDFPQYANRRQALFRLALALKSIDESTGFVKTASQLFHDYPNTEETSSVRLILGMQLFDAKEFAKAREVMTPVMSRPHVYERNVAKYRIGLVYLEEGKARQALTLFEQVISDPELKAQENPYQVGLKNRNQGKSDLKREALIDSIRAYTQVFEKDPQPLPYYSKLAPTELLFHEVIEKLALRYINLKKYLVAVTLLRTIGEHTVEPQKVIGIYRQVLLSIPPEKRPDFPVAEMQYLLEKYTLWSTHYQMPLRAKQSSFAFFEKQVRDLATTSHSIAKASRDSVQKGRYLARAREFYLLYLAFFPKTSHTSEMATDLADVYFAESNFLKSGEYYLRTFTGEFGRTKDRRQLVENAILCLQKKGKYSFYETLRMRGLLMASVEAYMSADPRKRRDSALNFLLAKTRYDQGFFPQSIEGLYGFVKAFPRSRETTDATELILDYFNTKTDYAGLKEWTEKLLGLGLPNRALNQKLARINKQAGSKEIHEKIRTLAGYDDFSQGKSYLNLAMTSDDPGLKSVVLQEALAKSQREGDFGTFFQAAGLMADKEKDPAKKEEVIESLGRENLKITQYYQSVGYFRRIASSAQFKSDERSQAMEKAVQIGLALRDWGLLRNLMSDPMFENVSANTKGRLREQLVDYIESPNQVPADLVNFLTRQQLSDDVLNTLFRVQGKLPPNARSLVLNEVRSRCGDSGHSAVCTWSGLPSLDSRKDAFLKTLGGPAAGIQAIQTTAQAFAEISGQYQKLEGSGDAFLESVLQLRSYELYSAFGRYLQSAAKANPPLKPVLTQKANETLATAKNSLKRCRTINEKSPVIHPAVKFCASGHSPAYAELFVSRTISSAAPPGNDPKEPKFENLKRAVFSSSKGNEEAALKLARAYLDEGKNFHAAASAVYGMGLYKNAEREFRAILGCAVLNLGYYSEANYHLGNAETSDGLKDKCVARLEQVKKL